MLNWRMMMYGDWRDMSYIRNKTYLATIRSDRTFTS